jgi:hypothetical protein
MVVNVLILLFGALMGKSGYYFRENKKMPSGSKKYWVTLMQFAGIIIR